MVLIDEKLGRCEYTNRFKYTRWTMQNTLLEKSYTQDRQPYSLDLVYASFPALSRDMRFGCDITILLLVKLLPGFT
jgi:hypothetical protein